jgi:hypothetical protein
VNYAAMIFIAHALLPVRIFQNRTSSKTRCNTSFPPVSHVATE